MNVEKLNTVFENFKKDNNRAILVDGPWGVGKTYQILQFLKKDPSAKEKEKNRIIYVSLFGKTTIDEIHTDIYSKLHPLKNGAKKFVQIIPKVAPLFGTVGNIISNMEFALNTDENKVNSLGENIENVSQKVENLNSCVHIKKNIFCDIYYRLVEHLTVNQVVAGSSPAGGAKKKASRETCFFLSNPKDWYGITRRVYGIRRKATAWHTLCSPTVCTAALRAMFRL